MGRLCTTYALTSDLHPQWRGRLGADHEHTLAIGDYLAWALEEVGRWAGARDLHQDTLDCRCQTLGQEHPDTLSSADNLAADLRTLGEAQTARDLEQDTGSLHRDQAIRPESRGFRVARYACPP
jgi:Tetratricopeptide repeat